MTPETTSTPRNEQRSAPLLRPMRILCSTIAVVCAVRVHACVIACEALASATCVPSAQATRRTLAQRIFVHSRLRACTGRLEVPSTSHGCVRAATLPLCRTFGVDVPSRGLGTAYNLQFASCHHATLRAASRPSYAWLGQGMRKCWLQVTPRWCHADHSTARCHARVLHVSQSRSLVHPCVHAAQRLWRHCRDPCGAAVDRPAFTEAHRAA